MKYILRILGMPFLLGLTIVSSSYRIVANMVQFIRFGGEFVVYKKDSRKRIADLMNLLDEKL